MPLVYQQNINLHSRLGLWHINETEIFFTNRGITANDVRHPHKRLQTLSGRLLLTELVPDFPINEVLIAPTRKPFLPDDPYHFSISHCDNYAAAIISSEQRVGVDIEVPQQKILRLTDKFLSPREQEIVKAGDNDALISITMAWCMKEAVFKWYGDGRVDFREHMPLINFSATHNRYAGNIAFKKNEETHLSLSGLLVNGNCLAWVCSA